MPTRRRYPIGTTLLLCSAVTPGARAISQGPISVAQKTIATVPNAPIDLTYAPGDSTARLFVAGQNSGDVLVRSPAGVLTTFLDVNGAVGSGGAGLPLVTGGERGLLGMAFHPNFFAPAGTPGSGKFYTYTSETKADSVAGTDFVQAELIPGNLGDHDAVLREWSVDPANPNRILPTSSRPVFRVREPQSNHNGGAIHFGPDGYLYIAFGDGGGGDDNSGGASATDDGHANPYGNGQTLNDTSGPSPTTNVLGKLLRIDPVAPGDNPASTDPVSANNNYRVPAANPFLTNSAKNEIFASGLRNPFRFSFDSGGTHDLYVADVGQGAREEIDIVTAGLNYGWPAREGSVTGPRSTPPGFAGTGPVADYTHADGVAVIGGFVYRGSNFPEIYGKYVFGDLSLNGSANGRLFYLNAAGGTISEFQYYAGSTPGQLHSIGEGADGELYALWSDNTVRKLLGRQWNGPAGGSWATAANWIGGVPSSVNDDARFLGETTVASTITLDGNRTVGSLLFNSPRSYTIAQGSGGGTLTVNRLVTIAAIDVLAGSHTISAPLALPGTPTLSISPGASLKISGPLTGSVGQTFIDPTATLDLTTNDLLVNYVGPTPLPTLRALLASAFNNNTWTGPGITSSSAAANPNHTTSLAYAEAADLLDLAPGQTTTFAGQTVDATTVIIKYTYAGDLNLDGVINGDDFAALDLAFASPPPAGTADYLHGDFNFDGNLTPADYLLIDTSYAFQSGPLSPEFLAMRESQFGPGYVSELLASVPEPSLLSSILYPLSSLLIPRRRRQN